jgi:hypothetical protein
VRQEWHFHFGDQLAELDDETPDARIRKKEPSLRHSPPIPSEESQAESGSRLPE